MDSARICIVAPEFIGPFPNGGVGTACYWEAVTLARAGFDVTVLYTGPTERETPEHWEAHFAATAPFRYVDLAHCAPDDTSPSVRVEFPCSEARTAERVLAWLRAQPFDLLLFQEFLGHGARALQARHSGDALDSVRAATTLHSCRQWIYEGMHRLPGGPWDLAVDFLEKESARLADRVVAPSRHMAEWAASHWRLDAPAAVIPYCYDASHGVPPSLVEHAGPFRHLVFFGRLETRKGLHLFCRALASSTDLCAHVDEVTFLGKPSSVEGLPSDVFIADHMERVPGVRWSIKGNLGSFEAHSWLAAQPNVLVVAPSLVDNLPYALIELHTHRIPFVSTNIGGIPDIVGEANRHLLADATEASLASVLERICRTGRLVVDYRSGYDAAASNDAHVAFVRRMLAESVAAPIAARRAACDIVVVNAPDDDALARVRERWSAADPFALDARWIRFETWRDHPSPDPALFVDARVVPEQGCAERLLAALTRPGLSAATSYYVRDDGGEKVVVAPLGGSLEAGWRQNTFGGPCIAASPPACAEIARSTELHPVAFWPAYASIVCSGMTLGIVPVPLYTVPADAMQPVTHTQLEAVLALFHTHRPPALDLGWVLKSALAAAADRGPTSRSGAGRALYDRFVATPDDLLLAYAGLDREPTSDPFLRDLRSVRQRLASVVARWEESDPRVFVYGAGQHAKMMFAVCPELGRFVDGFIDRRSLGRFLGKPCVSPDEFRNDMADAIVYSSREFEHDMYVRLRGARVEHVLLYHESPPAPEASTTARLRNRFGHEGADTAALDAMYRPPSWATGYVSGSDAAFLAEMIAAVRPRLMVEIGVASGASSAAILQALDALPHPQNRVLLSCDVRATCYFDEAYETGQACRGMYPAPKAGWQREFASDARQLREILASGSVDLTFIDANHAHPWPLLDLLHTTAFAKPGSWVVLHDIDLPVQHPEYQVFGPRWLFGAWPFNKVKGVGRWTSIGAVQIPDNLSQLVSPALSLLDRPWEQAPTAAHAMLPAAFASVQATLEARLRSPEPVGAPA